MSVPAVWLALTKFSVPSLAATFAFLFAIETTEITLGALGAIQAIFIGWMSYRQARGEHKSADADRKLTATDRFVDQVQEQLNNALASAAADRQLAVQQQQEMHALRLEMTEVQIGVLRLTGQLEAAGLKPEWEPPPTIKVPGAG